jgi:hypothetical protein
MEVRMSSPGRAHLPASLVHKPHDDVGPARGVAKGRRATDAAPRMDKHIKQIRELIVTNVGMIDA